MADEAGRAGPRVTLEGLMAARDELAAAADRRAEASLAACRAVMAELGPVA